MTERRMEHPGRQGWRAGRAALALVLLWAVLAGTAVAGTTGKLSGTVTDAKQKPLAGASVVIVDRQQGAWADLNGHYDILNIPPGVYDVNFSFIGYRTLTVKGVEISADLTTRLDAQLEEAPVRMDEVVITAERPIVDVNLTSSRATLSSEEIDQLPVQELQDLVNLQAGVVDGHFRGGRKGEVQYQIDGVSTNNVYDNTNTLRIDRSLLQEVQVISGTFDAEYGQAMSGVVNAVLREGTGKFRWDGEVYLGGFIFPGRESRKTDDEIRPTGTQSYQGTISGPLRKGTFFLLSGRRYEFDDFVYGQRIFNRTDHPEPETQTLRATGNGEQVPLGYSREWSGVAKITSTLLPQVKLSYQALFNRIEGRRVQWSYRLNPDGSPIQTTRALVHGLDLTHTVGTTTYYSLSFRQNWFEYEDFLFEDVYDPRYDEAPPEGISIGYDRIDLGASSTRFRQATDTWVVKSFLVSQVNAIHNVKVGAEVSWPRMEFGTPGHLIYTTGQLVRHVNEPPDYPGVKEYRPTIASAYAQDQIEWTDLTVRAGLRLDWFDAHAALPSDLSNPANAIAGAPESTPKPTTRKVSLAPRLGVAYPISARAGLHFSYGHFYQFPGLGEIFRNADYNKLATLQASAPDPGPMGNPDIKPEQTTQYEFGFKVALTPRIGLDTSVFYKDIRDLLGAEFISTYNDAEYSRLTNADFGNVLGFTVALDQQQIGLLSTSLDYTWQRAQGNTSDPRETATRASAGEDPRPRLVPFNWDQRHTLNLTATFSRPGGYSVAGVFRVASGQPYTPVIEQAFGTDVGINSGRKPASLLVDLRGAMPLQLPGWKASAFFRVFNLFDARFSNGFVFATTGSPYYSREPIVDAGRLADPTRFNAPRRMELGLTFGSEGE